MSEEEEEKEEEEGKWEKKIEQEFLFESECCVTDLLVRLVVPNM